MPLFSRRSEACSSGRPKRSRVFSLQSQLTPEQCMARLRQAADVSPSRWVAPGTKRIVGWNSGTTFELKSRSGSSPNYIGTFTANRSGTTIEGYFRSSRSRRFFAFVWFGACACVPLSVELLAIQERHSTRDPVGWSVVAGLVFSLVMALVGAVLMALWTWSERTGEKFIADFLKDVLQVTGQGASGGVQRSDSENS
jgi:hypothetical protein